MTRAIKGKDPTFRAGRKDSHVTGYDRNLQHVTKASLTIIFAGTRITQMVRRVFSYPVPAPRLFSLFRKSTSPIGHNGRVFGQGNRLSNIIIGQAAHTSGRLSGVKRLRVIIRYDYTLSGVNINTPVSASLCNNKNVIPRLLFADSF